MSLRPKLLGRQRVFVDVKLHPEGTVVFTYEPRPERWRYDGCTVDDVLGRLNVATQQFAKRQAWVEVEGRRVPDPVLRRAIACEVQVVLDALVDAGHLWVVDEGKAS